MTRKKPLLLIFLFATAIGFFNPALSWADAVMPPFALPSVIDGSTIDSSSFKGKVLLVNFFATWCWPCQKEIPDLIKLQKKYGPDTFSVVGISVDLSSRKLVKKFITKRDVNYPTVMGDEAVAKDFGNVNEIPTTFLIDREGRIVKKIMGFRSMKYLKKDIERLLE